MTGNKIVAEGMNLSYLPPMIEEGEIVVHLLQEDIEVENQKWNKALIMYMVGSTPSIGEIERYIASQWSFVSKPKILLHNDRYFVIKLNSSEDRDTVLFSRPYSLNNRPIIIKAWTQNCNFNEEVLKIIPLWVKLPNLYLNCWSKESLSKIGSGLGKPLYADDCTTTAEGISYARILVWMDVTRPLPNSVKICDPKGKIFEQPILYDWKLVYCSICCQVGESCLVK